MGGFIDVDLCVPAFNPAAQAQLRRAYAQALTREVERAQTDLSEARIRRLTVHGAAHLADRELDHLFAVLHRSCDLAGAVRTAEVDPELLSTALMTPLRNFHTDLYGIDLGSLDAVKFRSLGRPYDFRTYESLERLLHAYDMHGWRADISLGMAGQTEHTLERCLGRLVQDGPGAVRLGAVDRPAMPAEKLAQLWAHAEGFLKERGYTAVNRFELALPSHTGLLETYADPQPERWGFGAGATSFIDGCLLSNEPATAAYIERVNAGEDAALRAVRPDAVSAACAAARRGLRSLAGLDVGALERAHGHVLNLTLARLCASGLTRRERGRVLLTETGAVQADSVWRALDPTAPGFAGARSN